MVMRRQTTAYCVAATLDNKATNTFGSYVHSTRFSQPRIGYMYGRYEEGEVTASMPSMSLHRL